MKMHFAMTTNRRSAATLVANRPTVNQLARTYVETGDERCPLAGIWLRLNDAAPQTDEPELARPTMRRLLSWWAIHVPITIAC